MPDMLGMPTGQLGDPMMLFIEMETGDATLHLPPVSPSPRIL
jgi:hypothetical protein